MTEYTELKPLLEACRTENCDGPREFRKAVEALFDVCTVETISALIAENERLNAECKQLILLECYGGTAQAAINLLAERDQLKAEIGELRKYGEEFAVLAERRREEVEALRNALRPLLAHWDDLKAGESLNVDAARAAMGNGEQS